MTNLVSFYICVNWDLLANSMETNKRHGTLETMQSLYVRDSGKCFFLSFTSHHGISVVPGQALCLASYYCCRDNKVPLVWSSRTLEGSVLTSVVTAILQIIQKLEKTYMRIQVTALLCQKSLMATTVSPNVPQAVNAHRAHSSHSNVLKEALSLLLLPLKCSHGAFTRVTEGFIVQGHL